MVSDTGKGGRGNAPAEIDLMHWLPQAQEANGGRKSVNLDK